MDDQTMKTLAIMQNMWFKNPAAARAIFARYPERRNALISRFLFAGCLTGARLRAAFGDLCDRIIWEEASPEIGGHSGSKFKADPAHIAGAITLHKPQIILTFGAIADDGFESATSANLYPGVYLQYILKSPHPAARGGDVPARLSATATLLRELFKEGG